MKELGDNFLDIPEQLLNKVIFQNSFEWLLLKQPRKLKHVQNWRQKAPELLQVMLFGCFIIGSEHNFEVCERVCFQ